MSARPGPARDVERRFAAALDATVESVKRDRSILAAILCGSLSHDVVWDKSDIDLVLVTIDDRLVPSGSIALVGDDVNVHATTVPRAEFRRIVEGTTQHSFLHSYLAKGRLLYTHDETIAALCERLGDLRHRDRDVQLLVAGLHALSPVDKARKWFETRRDLEYAALWTLYAATPIAKIEVLLAGRLVDREAIPQAQAINPSLLRTIYSALLNEPKTETSVRLALDTLDDYLDARADRLFAPILAHLADVGDTRSCRDIDAHFERHWNIASVVPACEYLADRGRLGRAATSARLTKKSHVDVQELAFYAIDPVAD